MSAELAVLLVPYGSDPLTALAEQLLDRHRDELPDLSRHIALFPSTGVIPRFRKLLLAAARERGGAGVLAPWCGTLETWLEQSETRFLLLDPTERELLLLEALEDHPRLRERFGAWALIDSLVALFDELNTHRPLPKADLAELTALLAAGYQADVALEPLRGEAELVYTLWNSWNTHLVEHQLADRSLHRLAALARFGNAAAPAHHIYMIGTAELTRPQADWLKPLLARGNATLLLHGGTAFGAHHPDSALRRCFDLLDLPLPAGAPPADAYSQFLDAVYCDSSDIAARARAYALDHPASPAAERLRMYPASDFEQEARAVDLAVRRWRAAGVLDIGIVTHERKLARRVRALLERANLKLRDSAGWALSTTSAATVVMRWMECLDEDFAHRPLLDLLKSPFITLGLPRTELENLVHRFEQDIVRGRNVSAGLDRYRRAAEAPRFDETMQAAPTELLLLLDRLRTAAAPMLRLRHTAPRAPTAFLKALHESLTHLGLTDTLATDPAGIQVLTVLRPHRRSLTSRGPRFDWTEFRRWQQRELERSRFHVSDEDDGVELLGLAESRCRRFDALILAGCNREHLPGPLGTSPFFNDGVRARLGLPTRADRLAAPLHDFRRLLESAPRLLITWRRTERGEPLVPSPWTERLATFHRLAYGGELHDTELDALLAAPATELLVRDAPLPAVASRPAPALPLQRMPQTLSASSHQQLLDCPYQFFAAVALGLEPLDSVREELEKSDYGRLVHRILEAFHAGVRGLPGPWVEPITTANRPAAEQLLRDLGRRLLAYDKDRRFSTRGWQYRWELFVPVYLAWQQKRDQDWRPEAAEQMHERTFASGALNIRLRGRIDRIDRGPAGVAILDYKTGGIPETDAVAAGEHSQLPFYALLAPEVAHELAYAVLHPDRVEIKTRFDGEALQSLMQAFEQRLHTLLDGLARGARLPAQGDTTTCGYCRFEGMCRKQMWDTTSP